MQVKHNQSERPERTPRSSHAPELQNKKALSFSEMGMASDTPRTAEARVGLRGGLGMNTPVILSYTGQQSLSPRIHVSCVDVGWSYPSTAPNPTALKLTKSSKMVRYLER